MTRDPLIVAYEALHVAAPILARYGRRNDEAWAAYSGTINAMLVLKEAIIAAAVPSGSA